MFFRKDLNTILGAFNKIRNQLGEYAAAEHDQADFKSSYAQELLNDAQEHKRNAIRAGNIQMNISKLLSVD